MTKKIIPIPSGILCKGCNEDIPQQRLKACPGTTTCVNCSNTKTKKPITIQQGTGDDTYTETLIVDDETYNKYRKMEAAEKKFFGIDSPFLEGEEENK